MKLSTVEIITKAVVTVTVGAGTAFLSSISQWSNADSSPTKMQWVIIGVSSIIAGGNALSSFLSGSYMTYKANGGTANPTVTTSTINNVGESSLPIK